MGCIMSNIDDYIAIVPTARQMKVQRESFNIFYHYGLNTFTGKEWGDGKADPALFNPSEQNTDQWVSAAKEAGAYGVILTCKHHDGFCLWQTKTTDYSVASSPYKDGKGDVVREVSDSCRKYGLKFGVYLSPWDRNNEFYSTDKYNDIYAEQLTELLTNYGEIFCVWLDGACGAHRDGKTRQKYDWDRFFGIVRKLQPYACLSNCAPDIRWVGNEGGIARESEWNVVPAFSCDIQTIESKSQHNEDDAFLNKTADIISEDLGSRSFLANYDKFMWYPSEVDVSIRPGWFYHAVQDDAVRSLDNLLNIYYNAVGGNSLLLLNVPPDRRGLLCDKDVKRLKELGNYIKNNFVEAPVAEIFGAEAEDGHSIENVLTLDYDAVNYEALHYYAPKDESDKYEITVRLAEPMEINRLRIIENCKFSQRIEEFRIYAVVKGQKKLVHTGSTVGYNRIAVFKKPIYSDTFIISIDQCRHKPYIEYLALYKNDGFKLKKKRFAGIIKYFHHKYYTKMIEKERDEYIKRTNGQN